MASRFVGKMKGKMLVIFDLLKVLMEGKVFLARLIRLYQMKFFWFVYYIGFTLSVRVCCPIW